MIRDFIICNYLLLAASSSVYWLLEGADSAARLIALNTVCIVPVLGLLWLARAALRGLKAAGFGVGFKHQ
jgi:multisubunit Na+/H+ antiporter MnhF subunit